MGSRELDDQYKRIGSKNSYKNKRFDQKKSMIDDYTSDRIFSESSKHPPNKSADIDHIIPLDKIKDRYPYLSSVQKKELANNETNYAITNASLNRSKNNLENHEHVFKNIIPNAKKEIGDDIKKGDLIGALGKTKKTVNTSSNMLKKEAQAKTVMDVQAAGYVAKGALDKTEKIAGKISDKVKEISIDKNTVKVIADLSISLKDCTTRYVEGEIDGAEYLCELLEDGFGYIVKWVSNAVGDLIGGPIAGAVFSEILCNIYNSLVRTFRECRLSEKRLKEIQEVAKRIKDEQERYRKEFQKAFLEFYDYRQDMLDNAYNNLVASLLNNNVDAFINAVNELGKAYGIECTMGTFKDIDEKMSSDSFVWNF